MIGFNSQVSLPVICLKFFTVFFLVLFMALVYNNLKRSQLDVLSRVNFVAEDKSLKDEKRYTVNKIMSYDEWKWLMMAEKSVGGYLPRIN